MLAPTAFGQLPALPNVYSDPAINCYALLSRVVDTGIAFTGVRLNPDSLCDITPQTPLQFIAVQLIDGGSPKGWVFLKASYTFSVGWLQEFKDPNRLSREELQGEAALADSAPIIDALIY